jgi:transcriptional regulator
MHHFIPPQLLDEDASHLGIAGEVAPPKSLPASVAKRHNGRMYLPAHFTMTETDDIERLLADIGAADLITRTSSGLASTFLPLLYVPKSSTNADRKPGTANESGNATFFQGASLHGHVTRANHQWKSTIDPEALVIVHGTDGYISPNSYPSKAENAKTVPTWNYTTLNIHGKLVVHDDPAWTLDLVRRLTNHHEAKHAAERNQIPWSVDDAPSDYIDTMVKGIVGIEIVIDRIEAKAKLSQNKTEADALGAARDLEQGTATEVALSRAIQATRAVQR